MINIFKFIKKKYSERTKKCKSPYKIITSNKENENVIKNFLDENYNYNKECTNVTSILNNSIDIYSDKEEYENDRLNYNNENIVYNHETEIYNSTSEILYLSSEQKEFLKKYKSRIISLYMVPDKCKDRLFCLEVVKINGYALMDVPKNIINLDICIEAVKNTYYAINYVPEVYKDIICERFKINRQYSKPIKEDNDSVENMMQEYIPGVSKQYWLEDYHSHDYGSLYDQFEHINDNL